MVELSHTIYGSPLSLFTRKLEAALHCYGLAFASLKKRDHDPEALEQRAGTHQVPVLRTPENWMLADTTPIIMLLDGRYPERRLFPNGPLGVLAHIVEEILDEWMARTMVHYRWHYDENTLAVVSELCGRSVSLDEAREYPLAQWGLRACRATGTESAPQQRAAEQEYLDILRCLNTQLETTRYCLGDRPSAVDTILIGSLRGHTIRDPLPDLSIYDTVLDWNVTFAKPANGGGEWAPFPDSTPLAAHILKLGREQYRPFILGNAAALARGDKAFVVETYGEPVSYLCRDYPERSRQMITQRIVHGLTRDERAMVCDWLAAVGLTDCFAPADGVV